MKEEKNENKIKRGSRKVGNEGKMEPLQKYLFSTKLKLYIGRN